MTQWLEVNDILDLLGNVWIGLVLIAVAAVPSWYAARNHKSLEEVKGQVINGHAETNLRNDLDRAIQGVETLAHDVRGLRADLHAEEERRRSQIEQIYDELDHRIGKHRRN